MVSHILTNEAKDRDKHEDAVELFVPGRLALFGEHSDWAGSMRKYNSEIVPGRAIVVGINRGLYAHARAISDPILRITSTTSEGEKNELELSMNEDTLAEASQRGGFWSYVAGVAYIFATEFHVGGLCVDNYKTTLPIKRGLSSSAAISVLIARAFNQVYHLGLTTRGEMQAAYEGERLTPSQCGRMDQALAFGAVPVVMTFSGDVLRVLPARLGARLYLVLVDLVGGSKDTVKILSSLQQAYPHPATPQEHDLVRLLGPINEDITARAIEVLAAGDAEALGKLMLEAQAAFNAAAAPLCPSQLGEKGSHVLHQVLSYPSIQKYIFGGKGVGSQGDGTAQLVCRNAEAQDAVCAILENDLGVHCIQVTLESSAGEEAGQVGLMTVLALKRQAQRLEAQLEKTNTRIETLLK